MLILFTLLVTFNSFAQDIQLSKGSHLSMTKMWGDVSVLCYDDINQDWKKIYCFQYHLDEGNQDYLKVSSDKVDADYIIIKRDKDSHFQESFFDKDLQQSESVFTLWDPTLKNPALLKLGENLLHVSFKKDDEIVLTDSLKIEVNILAEKQCETGLLSYPNKCPSAQVICTEYFIKNNSCRLNQGYHPIFR